MSRIIAAILALVAIGLIVGVVFLRNTSNVSSKSLQGPPSTHSIVATEDPLDALRKASDLEAYRGAVQQLNQFFQQHPDRKPALLNKEEEERLTSEFHLDDDELKEINSGTFTLLDAHYLELCFLMRDVVRSLKVENRPPLERATAAFAWVMRQVRLQARAGDLHPPLFVLRRGWGSAPERAMVFLALLQQLGTPGCMIAVPGNERDPAGVRYWIPGALVDKQIYLFDDRLGFPLPGVNGDDLATLAQVCVQPELLRRLTVDEKLPYDVDPDKGKQAQVHLTGELSALSPRMRELQNLLSSQERIVLAIDASALREQFQAAFQNPALANCKRAVWNAPGDPNTPFRVLRHFLPKEEGGADEGHRKAQAQAQVVPWNYFPPQLEQISALPGAAEIGQRLKGLYANPFVYFHTEPRAPNEILLMWLPGLTEESKDNKGTRKPMEILSRGGMPRDLVLRGRYDEAAPVLVAIHREMQIQRKLLADPTIDKDVREWCKKAISAYAGLIQASGRDQKANSPSPGMMEARQRVDKLWEQSNKVVMLIKGAAAVPMSGDVIYLLALCKQEQAERDQAKLDQVKRDGRTPAATDSKTARNHWQAAAGWWETYLDENANAPAAPSARLLRARALLAVGERDSAVALLENLSGNLTDLEKTGRLYLAKQLKER